MPPQKRKPEDTSDHQKSKKARTESYSYQELFDLLKNSITDKDFIEAKKHFDKIFLFFREKITSTEGINAFFNLLIENPVENKYYINFIEKAINQYQTFTPKKYFENKLEHSDNKFITNNLRDSISKLYNKIIKLPEAKKLLEKVFKERTVFQNSLKNIYEKNDETVLSKFFSNQSDHSLPTEEKSEEKTYVQKEEDKDKEEFYKNLQKAYKGEKEEQIKKLAKNAQNIIILELPQEPTLQKYKGKQIYNITIPNQIVAKEVKYITSDCEKTIFKFFKNLLDYESPLGDKSVTIGTKEYTRKNSVWRELDKAKTPKNKIADTNSQKTIDSNQVKK